MHKNDKDVVLSAMVTLLFTISAVTLYSVDLVFLSVLVSLYSTFGLFATGHALAFRKYEYVSNILTKTR